MTDVAEKYLDEMIRMLDFQSLNAFLNEHMRTKMSFEELVAQICTHGLEALNKENITTLVFDTFFYEISVVRPIFLKMLAFALLFSIVHRLLATRNKYISDISFLVIYATLMVLLMQSFFLVRDIAIEGINSLLVFLNALIPTYAAVLSFCGNAVSATMLYEAAFVVVYLVEAAMKTLLNPLIHLFVMVLFLNHLFEEDKLSKLADLIESGIGLLLKVAFGFVIGLGVVQSLLTPVKDRIAGHVVFSGISAIPGLGNLAGSAGEIVLSCGMLIKNSVGVLGLILLFFVAVIPVLKIGCFVLMYQLICVLLQPVADARITECVSGMARGCQLYLKMILYSMLLFFILFSMISVATSFVF